VQPALDYFEKHFNSTQGPLLAFKAAHYFIHQKINNTQIQNSESILDGLKGEFPSYLTKVSDIDSSIDILQWWCQNESGLPCWATAALIHNCHLQHQKKCFHCLKRHSIPNSKVHCRIISKLH